MEGEGTTVEVEEGTVIALEGEDAWEILCEIEADDIISVDDDGNLAFEIPMSVPLIFVAKKKAKVVFGKMLDEEGTS